MLAGRRRRIGMRMMIGRRTRVVVPVRASETIDAAVMICG